MVGPSAALHSFIVQCKESFFVLSSGNSLKDSWGTQELWLFWPRLSTESFGNWRGHRPGCNGLLLPIHVTAASPLPIILLFALKQLSLWPCLSAMYRPPAQRPGAKNKLWQTSPVLRSFGFKLPRDKTACGKQGQHHSMAFALWEHPWESIDTICSSRGFIQAGYTGTGTYCMKNTITAGSDPAAICLSRLAVAGTAGMSCPSRSSK